jgi:hypothetical protein
MHNRNTDDTCLFERSSPPHQSNSVGAPPTLDRRGRARVSPKILLASTCRWLTTARLSMAFADVGCAVEVVCPGGHAVAKTRSAGRIHRYRALFPLQSFRTAIETAQPDLIIPCDDVATAHLHVLYERAVRSPACSSGAELLNRSLGAPSSFSTLTSRTKLMVLARELGIRVPATEVAADVRVLKHCLPRIGFPAVLKSDGTYGGRGVRIVHNVDEAERAFNVLRRPLPAARALKRALLNRDASYLRSSFWRTQSIVNVQAFVPGRNANSSVACWESKVLAKIDATVLQTVGPNGPSSVIRLVNNREMTAAVERIVSRLRLTGLLGFDFIFEEGSGEPYLIEMNPRATQIAHLQLGSGRDLTAALRAALSGEPLRVRPSATANDVIAFFPQEWNRQPESPFLRTAHHDVPWDEPALVREALRRLSVNRSRDVPPP